MKNKILIFFAIIPFFLQAQSVPVMNYDNGTKATVPTTSSNQLLPQTGSANTVPLFNGTSWTYVDGAGVTYQTLVNHWTKTGNNLFYLSGDVNIGSQSVNIRRLNLSGTLALTFNNTAPPSSDGVNSVFFGVYNAHPANVAGMHYQYYTGGDIGDGVPQAYYYNSTGANGNHIFRTNGSSKFRVSPVDVRFPYLAGSQNRFAILGAADELIDGPQLSSTTPISGQVLMFASPEYVPTTSGGDVSGNYNNLQIVADAVTTVEIATSAVGTNEIANATILFEDIAQNGATTGQVPSWNGTVWVPSTLTGFNQSLDQAYNNFGATPSTITVDANEGQTGGLEFETTGTNDFVIDMQGTGDFKVQDGVRNVLQVNDSGYTSFGTNNPTSSQRILSTDSLSSFPTLIRLHNEMAEADGVGSQFAMKVGTGEIDKFGIKAGNPTGTNPDRVEFEANENDFMVYTPGYNLLHVLGTRSRDIQFENTGTSFTIDGRKGSYHLTGATIVTVNLPEIVAGEPTTGQVKVGTEIVIHLTTASAVNITANGSEIIRLDGSASSGTTLAVSAGVAFSKVFTALGNDEWMVR